MGGSLSAFASYESTHCLFERNTGQRVYERVRAAGAKHARAHGQLCWGGALASQAASFGHAQNWTRPELKLFQPTSVTVCRRGVPLVLVPASVCRWRFIIEVATPIGLPLGLRNSFFNPPPPPPHAPRPAQQRTSPAAVL